MERLRPYVEHAYKYKPDLYVIVDSENYELMHILDDEEKAIEIAIQVLLEERFVKLVQGPGPWLTLDLDKGVDPKGEYHSDRIPPHHWEKLSNEIREKLK